MKLLDRLLGHGRDDREGERPLWHAIIASARQPRWYRELGVADTVAGRFDMISVVLSLVLLRLECEPATAPRAARLTELFIADMDGQLRQAGVGDLAVGKHVGKLMGVLGGRLGALRGTLAVTGDEALAEVLRRNMTMVDEARAPALAAAVRGLAGDLEALGTDRVLAGEMP